MTWGALGGGYVLLVALLRAVVEMVVCGDLSGVRFLIVVMLLNLRTEAFPPGRQKLVKLAAVLVGLAVLAQFLQMLSGGLPEAQPLPEGYGGYVQVGMALYTDYVLLVEMASLLLLAAIVGALILAKRKID